MAKLTIYKWINESKTTDSFKMKVNITLEQLELVKIKKPARDNY